jgi:hypothetical protein
MLDIKPNRNIKKPKQREKTISKLRFQHIDRSFPYGPIKS